VEYEWSMSYSMIRKLFICINGSNNFSSSIFSFPFIFYLRCSLFVLLLFFLLMIDEVDGVGSCDCNRIATKTAARGNCCLLMDLNGDKLTDILVSCIEISTRTNYYGELINTGQGFCIRTSNQNLALICSGWPDCPREDHSNDIQLQHQEEGSLAPSSLNR